MTNRASEACCVACGRVGETSSGGPIAECNGARRNGFAVPRRAWGIGGADREGNGRTGSCAVDRGVLVVSCSGSSVREPRTPPPPVRESPASLPPPVRPDPEHVRTLSAALDGMVSNYPELGESTPGAQDIFDYHVGALWKQGIDGTGTTIALIEGWDDSRIDDVIKEFDKKYGLPDPEIRTIYPSDGGHLPAQCPPGMVALGSYGSCDAWKGELELDVKAAHLIAPYAKILIAATPADSEMTDDAASQVAPPEMMQALEYIAGNHLADVISISDGTGESTYSYGKAEIIGQEPGLLSAAAAGIPVLVATGDCGVVQNRPVASAQYWVPTRSGMTGASLRALATRRCTRDRCIRIGCNRSRAAVCAPFPISQWVVKMGPPRLHRCLLACSPWPRS